MKWGIAAPDGWSTWYAWRPIKIDEGPDAGKWVWREWILRSRFAGFWFYCTSEGKNTP